MKTASIYMAAIMILAICGFVRADYYDPPPWNNSDPTFTHQEWDFTTNANPAPPEIDNNPYGTPVFGITGATWFPAAAPFIPGSTRTGLWAGIGSGSAVITLGIPNQKDLTKYKYVWLQVAIGSTNISGLQMNVSLAPDDEQLVTVLSEGLYAMPSGEQYGYYYEKLWKICPQPAFETITANVNFVGGILAIDEVDVDTICIPEPATICLLSLGVFGLINRKR